MYDISLLIPAIRTPNWKTLYDSVFLACKKYKWQIIFVSPFDLPEELRDKENIKLIKSLGSVTRCVQIGVPKCDSDLFFLTVDDCTFAEDSLDAALDKFKEKCSFTDAMAMMYGEGGNLMDPKYWSVSSIGNLCHLPGIDNTWKIANQCIMHKEYFIELGGLDCRFEYLDKPIHDFMFRLQRAGGKIEVAPKHCCIASWFETTSGDHAPIHHAQIDHDTPLFNAMYCDPNTYQERIKIDFKNYLEYDKIWKRRFSKGIPTSYHEMCETEGYSPNY